MRNIKLTIEYDGTNYNGWHSSTGIAIQKVVEDAIEKISKEKTQLFGASRTDSGVHALGQVANFYTASRIKTERIPLALNSILPSDIVIRLAEEASEDFHSRFSCKGKKYRYTILNDSIPSALNRNYSYFCPYELDIDKMNEACKYLIGTQDFTSFRAAGSSTKTSTRTIFEANFVKADNNIDFYISGDGFLYNMVRIIVGTFLDIGRGKFEPRDIERIINSKDRKLAGKTVPAHGLCLMEVYY